MKSQKDKGLLESKYMRKLGLFKEADLRRLTRELLSRAKHVQSTVDFKGGRGPEWPSVYIIHIRRCDKI